MQIKIDPYVHTFDENCRTLRMKKLKKNSKKKIKIMQNNYNELDNQFLNSKNINKFQETID